MGKPAKARQARRLFVQHDTEQFQKLLKRFQALLSKRKGLSFIEDFDVEAEELIAKVFGEASDLLGAYEYAKTGEAGGLLNMQEEAQESGAHDVARESLQQRKQALESCLAALEVRRTGGGRTLAHARVSEYMSNDVRSVHKDASLKEAGRLLQKWRVGSLLVDDGSRYIGIITDTDLSRKGVAKGLDPNTTPARTCMSKPVITIEDDELLTAAIALMKQKSIRHVAVTEDETIIGVLSVSDLLRAYAELAGLDADGGGEEGE